MIFIFITKSLREVIKQLVPLMLTYTLYAARWNTNSMHSDIKDDIIVGYFWSFINLDIFWKFIIFAI